MNSKVRWPIAVALLVVSVLMSRAQTQRDVPAAQAHKPTFVTRIYTGPDGQSHAEEVEAPFTANGVSKLEVTSGAELHRMSPGGAANWHPGPRRQYVITLSGTGEIEVAGGKKVPVGPGHIDLIEDTTGQGHITRNFEERVTLWLPIPDQPGR